MATRPPGPQPASPDRHHHRSSAREVGFRSLTEGIDTTTPSGRLVFHLFGALAEFERELIRERTIAGLTAARTAAATGGRPRAMTPDKLAVARQLYDSKRAHPRGHRSDNRSQPVDPLPSFGARGCEFVRMVRVGNPKAISGDLALLSLWGIGSSL